MTGYKRRHQRGSDPGRLKQSAKGARTVLVKMCGSAAAITWNRSESRIETKSPNEYVIILFPILKHTQCKGVEVYEGLHSELLKFYQNKVRRTAPALSVEGSALAWDFRVRPTYSNRRIEPMSRLRWQTHLERCLALRSAPRCLKLKMGSRLEAGVEAALAFPPVAAFTCKCFELERVPKLYD